MKQNKKRFITPLASIRHLQTEAGLLTGSKTNTDSFGIVYVPGGGVKGAVSQ